jgi:hypothetical protein
MLYVAIDLFKTCVSDLVGELDKIYLNICKSIQSNEQEYSKAKSSDD